MNKPTPSPTGRPPGQTADSHDTAKPQQIGEGSYEGTRDYQKGMDNYLAKADVAADAQAARPADAAQAAELKKAEQEGLSHSKAKGQ